MLSIILLSYYSNERIISVYKEISETLTRNGIPFEFLIIDDGSGDNSYQLALELEKNNPNVRSYQLSKNFSSHYSIFAGLSLCNGSCAIPIPDDEQLPYQVLIDSYRLWEKGQKVVIPHRINRNDGILNNFFACSYYSIINALTDVEFPKGGADTFLIDRELIDILNSRIHPINTSVVAEVLRLGFQPVFYPYERRKGTNKKIRWTLSRKIRLFKDTLFSNSIWPIKVIARIGLFFSVISVAVTVLYSCNILFGDSKLLVGKHLSLITTAVFISFFSGIILFSLGIIAEYIWRIYEEVKNRPGYIIKKKQGEN